MSTTTIRIGLALDGRGDWYVPAQASYALPGGLADARERAGYACTLLDGGAQPIVVTLSVPRPDALEVSVEVPACPRCGGPIPTPGARCRCEVTHAVEVVR